MFGNKDMDLFGYSVTQCDIIYYLHIVLQREQWDQIRENKSGKSENEEQ